MSDMCPECENWVTIRKCDCGHEWEGDEDKVIKLPNGAARWEYSEGDIVAFRGDGTSMGVVDLNRHADFIGMLLN